MNVAKFLQERQLGGPGRGGKYRRKHIEEFVEERVAESHVNKACSVSGRCRSTFILEFSPDGTTVASAHGDHSVRVTDIGTGECVCTLRGHPRTPWCLAYHPSSSHILASGCLGGQVRIWDLYGTGYGCEVWQVENTTVIAALTFHPTEHVLVIAAGNSVYFWDWSKPEPFAKCSTAHEYERIRWVRFDSLGHFLYTGISNNTSAHREEVSNITVNVSSQERPVSSAQGQPSRLSSVYNNIINCFQDYRRDRLMNQLHSDGFQQHSASQQSESSNDVDLYPGVPDEHIVRPTSPSSIPQGSAAADNLSGERTRSDLFRTSDLDIGDSRVRHNRLLMTSYASRLAETSRDLLMPISERTAQRLRQSRATNSANVLPSQEPGEDTLNDSLMTLANLASSQSVNLNPAEHANNSHLLNPASDPFLASDYIERDTRNLPQNLVNTEAAGSDAAQFPLLHVQPAMRGVMSPPPVPVSNDFDDNILSDEGRNARSQAEAGNEEVDVASDNGRNSDVIETQVTCCGNSKVTQSGLRDSKHETNIGVSTSAVCDTSNVGETASSSIIRDPSVLSYLNNTNATPCIPLSPLLSKYLHSQKASTRTVASSSSKQPTKPFASIRDRLMTTIPLSSSDSSSMSESVSSTVKLHGIPQVTVISASNLTATSKSVTQQGSCVTTWTCNSQISSVNRQTRPTTGSGQNLNISTNQVPVISRLTHRRNSTERMRANEGDNSANKKDQSSSRDQASLGDIMNRYSHHGSQVVASTSSHTSLFENIFHNSNSSRCESVRPASRGSGRSYLSSFRLQPYNWQNRTRYMSMMGPYFESRRNSLANRHSLSQSSQSNCPNTMSVVDRAMSRVTPQDLSRVAQYSHNLQDMGRSRSHSRDQASSDTDSELSSHLNPSGAYFMPITDDPLRAHSSTSTRSASSGERSSDTTFLRHSSGSLESSDSAIGRSSRSSSSGTVPSVQGQGQDLELVMDQNENYTTQRSNANLINPIYHLSEIRLRNHDNNNNSIHIVQPENTTRENAEHTNQDYVSLRNNFVSMTDQIEREMSDLNRRISALRDSFNQSLVTLRQDRVRYETIGNQLLLETATNLPNNGLTQGVNSESVTDVRVPPVITVTGLQEAQNGETTDLRQSAGVPGDVPLSQPPTLLETSLRSHHRRRQLQTNLSPPPYRDADDTDPIEVAEEPQHWRQLHRHYLHPNYSTSILDDTINRPNNAIQSAINRAIAGAFMGTGESAVANNIINQTHRIQYWDFSRCDIPDISSSTKNIVVPHCKLHNSASCDISQNSELLGTFVPSHQGFPDDNILTVYSLLPETRGQCLYTKSFGPNAISISISPRNNFVLVGLAAKRLSWVFTSNQLVAQIYKLERKGAGEKSMKHTKDVMHTCNTDVRTHVSGNSARWLPMPGQGIVYGTNRGDLHLCKPGVKVIVDKADAPEMGYSVENLGSTGSIRRCLLRRVPWMNYPSPHRVSTSTQTAGVRQSASTQTEMSENTDIENEILV